MVLSRGVCWKSTAAVGIRLTSPRKDLALGSSSRSLFSAVSDGRFCGRVYSEPLTSCEGGLGGLPKISLKGGGLREEGWVFVLRIKNDETLLYTTDFLKKK